MNEHTIQSQVITISPPLPCGTVTAFINDEEVICQASATVALAVRLDDSRWEIQPMCREHVERMRRRYGIQVE